MLRLVRCNVTDSRKDVRTVGCSSLNTVPNRKGRLKLVYATNSMLTDGKCLACLPRGHSRSIASYCRSRLIQRKDSGREG